MISLRFRAENKFRLVNFFIFRFRSLSLFLTVWHFSIHNWEACLFANFLESAATWNLSSQPWFDHPLVKICSLIKIFFNMKLWGTKFFTYLQHLFLRYFLSAELKNFVFVIKLVSWCDYTCTDKLLDSSNSMAPEYHPCMEPPTFGTTFYSFTK